MASLRDRLLDEQLGRFSFGQGSSKDHRDPVLSRQSLSYTLIFHYDKFRICGVQGQTSTSFCFVNPETLVSKQKKT